jgi:hypothetical protein
MPQGSVQYNTQLIISRKKTHEKQDLKHGGNSTIDASVT